MEKKEVYNLVRDMLQSEYGLWPMTLENCTGDAQMLLPEKGDSTMAKHRIRVCIGYNDDGSPIEKMISGNTQHELADRAVLAILNSERSAWFLEKCGISVGGSATVKLTPTFKEYTDRWMQTYKVGKLRPKTLKGYESKLKVHLFPAFGDIPVNEITADGIQGFLNERQKYSRKSLKEMRTILSQIMRSAVTDGLISSNPAADKRLYIPSDIQNERSALSLDEWKDIVHNLDKLSGFDKLYLAIVAYTGLRRGEALGLQWNDIDLATNVIHVRRNVTHTSNQPIIGSPKTEKGTRDVPIMRGLLDVLLPLKESGYIVSHDKTPDEPLTLTAFKNMWERIDSTIDLHGATSHVFRHTIGTLLNDVGADPKTIQGVMGHADISTTMNIYVHGRDDRKQERMSMINDQLSA